MCCAFPANLSVELVHSKPKQSMPLCNTIVAINSPSTLRVATVDKIGTARYSSSHGHGLETRG